MGQYLLLKSLHVISVVLFLGNIVTGVLLALTRHYPILRTPWILWALILFGIWNESEYRRLSRGGQIAGADRGAPHGDEADMSQPPA